MKRKENESRLIVVEITFLMSLIYSMRNMELFMRGRLPIHHSQTGLPNEKTHTLTDLVNAMLDTSGLSKAWWGEAVLTSCHVLNKVPAKDNETTPYEQWEKKRTTLSYLRTWGCLAKVNVPIIKKRKLGPKTMDCVFLGYDKHSVGYRFLVVKSEVHDVKVDVYYATLSL